MFLKVFRKVQEAVNFFIALLFIGIVIIVAVQIVTRYIFFYSLPWSEEMSKYFFVWIVFLGVNMAVRDNLQIRIDFVEQLFKTPGSRRALHLFHHIASLVMVLVLAVSCFLLMRNGWRATSPAMRLPMFYVYMVMPAGMLLTAVEVAIRIHGTATGKEDA